MKTFLHPLLHINAAFFRFSMSFPVIKKKKKKRGEKKMVVKAEEKQLTR